MQDPCSRHNPKSQSLLEKMSNKELKEYAKIHVSMDSHNFISVLVSRLPYDNKTIWTRQHNFPMLNSECICLDCESRDCCMMNEELDKWNEIKTEYSPDEVPETEFKESYIEFPTIENSAVVWCPLYNFKETN